MSLIKSYPQNQNSFLLGNNLHIHILGICGTFMAGLAGLPIALASRGKNKNLFEYGKDAVSGLGSFIRNMSPGGQRTSMVTPEGFDMPFYETRGEGIGGLLDNQKLNVTPTKYRRVSTLDN